MGIFTTSISKSFFSNFSNLEFYQDPVYLNLQKEIDEEVIYWKYSESDKHILIPLIKRPITETKKYDLVSPYGYPGILMSGVSYAEVNNMISDFLSDCREAGFVSVFLRLHPFHNNFILPEDNTSMHCMHGRIVYLKLNTDYKSLFLNYSKNHKRSIKKLVEMEFSVKIGNIAEIDKFIEIYNQTMDRVKADSYYFFKREYYISLFKKFKDKIHLIFIVDKNDTIASAGIFIYSKKIIQYHLGATQTSFLKYAPSKLMFDFIIMKNSKSNKILNFGGGLGGKEDALFAFKKGFSNKTLKFSTFRTILNLEDYTCLTEDYSKQERLDLAGFFPLYRNKKNE